MSTRAVLLAGVLSVAATGCGDDLDDAPPGDIVGIELSPLALTPSFAPDVHDYYVRCAAGANPVTLTVTDTVRTETKQLVLQEDELVSVRDQYWVRCLPADFPVVTVATHPEVGAPTPGWYLVNSVLFAAVLDTQGTPVWYRRGTRVVNVSSPAPNTIASVPDSQPFPYGTSPTTAFVVRDLATDATTSVQTVGPPTDVHELVQRPNGNHVLLSYPLVPHVDLTGLSTFGADETIADCEVQEVDPAGNLVWAWRASDHVDPVEECLEPATNDVDGTMVVDVFHCNSIEVDAAGNLLVSMRHADALFYVERTSGQVAWKVGGSPVNRDGAAYLAVTADPQTAFYKQHDARFLPSGNVMLYDNHGVAVPGVARCAEYALDQVAGTATLVWQHLGAAQSGHQGGCRRHADGTTVIAWGFVADDPRVLTELDADGDVVLEVGLAGDVSYRALKVPPTQFDAALLRQTAGR
ncbi:MAG: aryl-sulfate sulfotransferase [Myxococcales bacterium]|nr:aryl-sulfate sulfotransferase [Myxococcales bacterium]